MGKKISFPLCLIYLSFTLAASWSDCQRGLHFYSQLGEQDLPIYHNKRYPNNYFLPYIEEEPTVN